MAESWMARFERGFESVEQMLEAGLSELQEDGSDLVTLEALAYCKRFGVTPTPWVTYGLERWVGRLPSDQQNRRGRAANIRDRYAQDYCHVLRWYWVKSICEGQLRARNRVEELRRRKAPLEEIREAKKELARRGRTRIGAYERVADLLAGSRFGGTPATMKASYLRIQGWAKNPSKAKGFRVLSPGALALLGLEDELFTLMWDKEGVQLFPLTH